MTKEHWFQTKGDGVLDEVTSPEDLRTLAEKAVQSGHIVMHLHGGLVSASEAHKKVLRLAPYYREKGLHLVMPVWRSGLMDVMINNPGEIAREAIFKTIVAKVIKWVLGKDKAEVKARGKAIGAGTSSTIDQEIRVELAKTTSSDEIPFGDWKPAAALPEPTKDEQERFLNDSELRAIEESIVAANSPAKRGAKGTADEAGAKTRLSQRVIDEIVAGEGRKSGQKGMISAAVLAKHALSILVRVVRRYRKGRDHGLYATVVEEILRELYIDQIGGALWRAIKKETADTFEQPKDAADRGGALFFRALGDAIAKFGKRPRFSVVGHSAGSIYACNMLAHIGELANDPTHPLPKDFKVRNLIFLAPAVDFDLFADTLKCHGSRFERFRMFSLSDAHESGYWELPALYPRSLLYLVSGLVESVKVDGEEYGASDHPIVGMQRFYEDGDRFESENVATVRGYIAQDDRRAVWSGNPAVGDQVCDALRHGAFDETDSKEKGATMRSVLAMLVENGE